MDILKAEIARKKQQIQQTDVLVSGKKYFKQSDLAAKQEEEYWKKCKRFKSVSHEAEGEQSANNEGTDDKNSTNAESMGIQLSRKEVIRRLRERNEPILLFGETEAEAFERLKNLEIEMPEINRGFKNDFKAALDKVDEDYLNEILNSAQPNSSSESTKNADVTVKESSLTLDEILDKSRGMGKGDHGLDSDVVLNFYKLLLQMWGDRLNGRSQQEKLTFKGKMASATHRQTVNYIKPLFRKLKKKELSPDLLECMVDIVKCLMDRDYLRANDAYLEMAIGKAPWPIGVTMVGIHARTGREKIFDRNVAHVLNDETQRKYIQAVKRLMTQCQKLFPTDPSRSVDYHSD